MFDWVLNTLVWNRVCAFSKDEGPGLQVHYKLYRTIYRQMQMVTSVQTELIEVNSDKIDNTTAKFR